MNTHSKSNKMVAVITSFALLLASGCTTTKSLTTQDAANGGINAGDEITIVYIDGKRSDVKIVAVTEEYLLAATARGGEERVLWKDVGFIERPKIDGERVTRGVLLGAIAFSIAAAAVGSLDFGGLPAYQ